MAVYPLSPLRKEKKVSVLGESEKVSRLALWKFDRVRNDPDEQERQAKEMTN